MLPLDLVVKRIPIQIVDSFARGSPPGVEPVQFGEEQRDMYRILIVLVAAAVVSMPAAASEKTDAMATVRQFVQGFNKGDRKATAAACAAETFIIDEFPPHAWHGAGACAKWMSDYEADARKNGMTGGTVTLGSPLHVDVTADRAYVVVPTSFTFKQKGKQVRETGSTLTVVLQKGGAGWRIIAWTWTKH
jgi:ketosteroid isomerase-like protein